MPTRTTNVDKVLHFVGVAIIVVSSISALLGLIAVLGFGRVDFSTIFGAVISVAPEFIAGCLFIGFAAIIRLLDEIRGLGEIALRSGPGQPARAVPRNIDTSGGITENSDGTYTVGGTKFKTLYTAKAHLEFLEGLRK